jgi:polysaccharide pyruvyl transferase WcaK-like protein/SAM-dependent methyltransferase
MLRCNICGNIKTTKFLQKSRDGDVIEVIRCKKCGYTQNNSKHKDIYSSGEFSKLARKGENLPGKQKIRHLDKSAFNRFNFYAKYINLNGKTLEVGSSIGSFVSLLRLANNNAEGLEPDPDYSSFSKKQYGFEQHQTTIENFNSNIKYDNIISFHVIEHISDPKAFIETIYNLTAERGTVIIECPSIEHMSYGNKQHTFWKPHLHYFSFVSLYLLLNLFFDIKKIGLYHYGVFIVAKKNSINKIKKVPFKLYIKSFYIKQISNICGIFKSNNLYIEIIRKQLMSLLVNDHLFKESISTAVKYIKYKSHIKSFLRKEKSGSGNLNTASHITLGYGFGINAGDVILSQFVRKTFNSKFNLNWQIHNLYDSLNSKTINSYNKNTFVVVGGGGLFIPDSNQNTISHWQWPITVEQLELIKKPLVGFAIGYNYFMGQETTPEFIDNLDAFVKRCDFVGLRNHGSIFTVNKLLNDKYVDKITFQPCPTTIISNIQNIKKEKPAKNIAINLAFDRYNQRFGNDYELKLKQIIISLKKLENQGFDLIFTEHGDIDRNVEILQKIHFPNSKIVQLHHCKPHKIINFYSNMDLVIGMRGHAQMIPFGVNTMILTLGTHNKMRWFLEDIDALDWYIDVRNTESLDEVIADKAIALFNSRHTVEDKLQTEQAKLYEITKSNLNTIRDIIGL